MVISMNSGDREKLRRLQNTKKVGNRKNRTMTLSDKTKGEALKSFEDNAAACSIREDIQIDGNVKLNDSYMRTGRYIPKTK